MRRRGLVLPAVAAAGCLLLSGCTVESGAVAGVGVDAQGRPVGFVQVCQGQIDSMTLWRGEGDDAAAGWTAAAVVGPGGFSTFSFAEPGPDWKAGSPAFTGIDPTMSYTLQGNGGKGGNEWSTQYVDFTTRTLRGLKPGEVRYWVGTNESSTKDYFKVSTVEEFKASACKVVTGDG
jgi:hypothetical protein